MATLNPGTRLEHYEIIGAIGAGGMGEVYSAADTKLGRHVAIKTLPTVFTHDADRVARFKREAKALAALNHPNIAIIHGLEESGGQQFLVMELVEGETLADKLSRGPLPIDEALRTAMQIAEALEAAHEKTIIHRDLKPANIKITPDGKVKVLDFGLAKAFEGESSSPSLSNSPTLTNAGTGAGIILGTAAYMSPEQAKGFAVDQRSDVFSFGCILYEMLTGKQVFDGDSVSEILASVLKSEPDLQQLPPTIHPRLRELLQRMLAKNPKRRIHAMADVRFEIESIVRSPAAPAQSVAAPAARGSRLGWIAAAIAVVAFVSLAVVHFREKPPPDPFEMRLEISTPSTPAALEFALSPDGRYIVFVATGDGQQRLWLHPLDKTTAQPLQGTEGADYPFWSPDSRSVAFTATGKLKRIDITGGPPQTLANTTAIRGGAWSSDGTILFSPTLGPLWRVSASGGEPVAVTRLSSGTLHNFPHFLPDGRHFLFLGLGGVEGTRLYLASLDGGEPKPIGRSDSDAAYLAPDMIVFTRQTTLFAQHLDVKRGELTGEPITVADPVGTNGFGLGGFSVSASGRIAYRTGGASIRQLRWYDRSGKAGEAAGEPDSSSMLYPELSPDGRRVAIQRSIQSNIDVWLMDLLRGGLIRFTSDPAIDGGPIWSPDGMQIAFLSGKRNGILDLYVKASNNAGPEKLVVESANNKYPQDWSKDGYLLYSEANPKTLRDLFAKSVTGTDSKTIIVAQSQFEESNGQFSPDGKWVAYETDVSGRAQVVVQSFPMSNGAVSVSNDGGIQPRWRADGKELYFIAPDDGKLMASSITITGSTLAAGKPIPLFTAAPATGGGINRHEYAVSKDGKFLINQPVEASTAAPITLLLNWKPK